MPFFGHGDVEAILKTLDGLRPDRPTFRDGGREMSDEHWTLVNLCWQEHASQRPSAAQVVAAMSALVLGSDGAEGAPPPEATENEGILVNIDDSEPEEPSYHMSILDGSVHDRNEECSETE